ncbi:hypothetical protein BDQ17DRAFT_1359261 [Cyathus striatus]|nr:hypothetical protein BDQ17DRAFT_1359261 [Cyathus striatus]
MTFLSLPPALDWPAQFCAFVTLATYVASILTSNVSQVDRLWTFLPTIYTAYYALLPLWPIKQSTLLSPYSPKELGWSVVTTYNSRALLMLTLITTWMCRLSYNTYRRGLFSLKDEDYRWAVLRKQLPAWFFQVTNFVFISGIQNVLLLLLGFPTKTVVMEQSNTPLASSDVVLAICALLVLTLEFTADNQQYAYQSYKHHFLTTEKGIKNVTPYDERKQWPLARLNWTPDDARRGFITKGLWRYSRHPNFACEQTFWWIITLFPLVAPYDPNLPAISEFPPQRVILISLADPELRRKLLNVFYDLIAPEVIYLLPGFCLSLLFFSSTKYTEDITKSKYPVAYDAYQRRVGMFGPLAYIEKGIILRLWEKAETRERIERLVWGKFDEQEKEE